MCDDITCEYPHLASVARMDDLIYDDLSLEYVRVWDELTI